jgi:hypothetical protein
MINSELLKEAIADAKAVRATSLANAKAALEEAFAPRFEAMFAEKLKEESEEDDENQMKEVSAPNQVDKGGGEAKAPKTKDVTKGQPQIRKGGKGDKDFKAVQGGEGPKDVPKSSKDVCETYEEEEENKMNEAGLTSEDLDEIIRELESEVATEEGGVPQEPEIAEFPPKGGKDDGEEGETDVNVEPGAEVNIEEPGAEGPAAEEPAAEEPGAEEEEPTGMNAGEPKEFPPVAKEPAPADDENINLEELIAALNEEANDEEDKDDDKKEKMDEMENNGVPTAVGGQDKSGGTNTYPKGPDASAKQLKGKNHNIDGAGNIGSGSPDGKPMREDLKKTQVALREAYKTIEFLRGQINEVNLLNAKLLYTNKLFKEFATVLDDNYRMKIIENFDLTKNVREVKLAYALLAESLNFGTQVRTPVSAAKKAPVTKGAVKQITEGFASKPVSSTKPSGQLITEGNVMALRFKKLAGIKEIKPQVASEKK